MNRKRRQLRESPYGRGEVYKDGKLIAVVSYILRVEKEMITSESISGVAEIPGLENITGQITVLEGELNLMDSNLILHLSDGRQWVFFPESGNPVIGGYNVISASAEGLKKVD